MKYIFVELLLLVTNTSKTQTEVFNERKEKLSSSHDASAI